MIDSSKGVFITAEGLLMYLQPKEAMGLIAECAKRFPGWQMFFDRHRIGKSRTEGAAFTKR